MERPQAGLRLFVRQEAHTEAAGRLQGILGEEGMFSPLVGGSVRAKVHQRLAVCYKYLKKFCYFKKFYIRGLKFFRYSKKLAYFKNT